MGMNKQTVKNWLRSDGVQNWSNVIKYLNSNPPTETLLYTSSDNTLLTYAIRANQLDVVKKYLNNVSYSQYKKATQTYPLHEAARCGKHEILAYITKNWDSKLNETNDAGHTPIYIGIKNNNLEVIKTILGLNKPYKAKGSDTAPPLIQAASNDKNAVITILVKNGADVSQEYDQFTPIAYALKNGSLDAAKTIAQLHSSCRTVTYEVLTECIHKTDLDYPNMDIDFGDDYEGEREAEKRYETAKKLYHILNLINIPDTLALKTAGYCLAKYYRYATKAFFYHVDDCTISGSMIEELASKDFTDLVCYVFDNGLENDISTKELKEIQDHLNDEDLFDQYSHDLTASAI